MSAPFSHWLRSLAIAAPSTFLVAGMTSAQNTADAPPPAAKDPAKEIREEKRDTTKDARDTAKEVRDDARDKTKDARDTKQEARETIRDTKRDARGEVRDARGEVREARQEARQETRDTVRDPRDPRDPVRDQSRDARDPANVRTPNPNRTDSRDVTAERTTAQAGFRAEGTRSADFGLWFDRDTSKGLVVTDVATKGAIAKLGFHEGDRIVSVNGQKVTRENDFVTMLFDDQYRNDRIKVIVIRDGREEVVLVEPAVLVEELSYVEQNPLENFGVVVDDRYDDRIVVWRVVPRSPAYYAGIRQGDVIVSLANRPLGNVAAFAAQVAGLDAGEIQLQIGRGQTKRTVHVDLPKYVQRSERRTTLRPNFDNAQDRRENVPAPRTTVPVPVPVPAPTTPPAVTPLPAPAPTAPAPAPANPPARPGLFPRGR